MKVVVDFIFQPLTSGLVKQMHLKRHINKLIYKLCPNEWSTDLVNTLTSLDKKLFIT